MMIIASDRLGGSLVVYDAILCRIASPDDRDKVSSRGWALGYLGGGLLLAINLVLVTAARPASASTPGRRCGSACSRRACGGRSSPSSPSSACGACAAPPPRELDAPRAGVGAAAASASSATPSATCGTTRNTMLFLLAYLFFNDGIQTVITSSSLYGAEQLGFEREPAHHADPARAVRRVRRRAALRPARRPLGRLADASCARSSRGR